MIRYGINDIRFFSQKDVRFLRQFQARRSPSFPTGYLTNTVNAPDSALAG
jgi:hypothetical protein